MTYAAIRPFCTARPILKWMYVCVNLAFQRLTAQIYSGSVRLRWPAVFHENKWGMRRYAKDCCGIWSCKAYQPVRFKYFSKASYNTWWFTGHIFKPRPLICSLKVNETVLWSTEVFFNRQKMGLVLCPPHPSSLGYCAAVSAKLCCQGRHATRTAHNHTSSSSVATEIEKKGEAKGEMGRRVHTVVCVCVFVCVCVCVLREI